MTDTATEKIYCMDRPSSDNSALWASLMSNQNNPAETAALLNGGANGQWNNPFIYLVWLMFANRMWNNNGETGTNTNSDLNRISAQIADNQNSNLVMDAIKGNGDAVTTLANNLNVDFNSLNSAVNTVKSAVDNVAGQIGFTGERVINSVLLGNKDLTSALQSCCCQTQQSILKMGYEGQLQNQALQSGLMGRIDQLANGVQTGFAQIGFNQAMNLNALQQSGNQNTQRIIDTLNQHWQADLQQRYADARLELSQQAQNAYLISQLKTTTTTTA